MRDDIVEYALQEAECSQVPYTFFIQDYKEGYDYIYCFYEGDDDKLYYSSRIKNSKEYKHNLLFPYTCNGKENVIELESIIYKHKQYSKAKLLFFIDKDFDDNSSISQNIYVTSCYSIENYYTADNVFDEILINNYSIRRNTDDFLKAKEIFDKSKKEFHSNVINLNAWLACQADYRKQKGSSRLNIKKSLNRHFSGNPLSDIVKQDFSIDVHPDIKDINKYNTIFPESHNIKSNDLNCKIDQFTAISKKGEIFRGKFELKFFISFLNRFKNNISSSPNSWFTKEYKCKLKVEECDIYTILSSYATTPDCLINYIEQKLK